MSDNKKEMITLPREVLENLVEAADKLLWSVSEMNEEGGVYIKDCLHSAIMKNDDAAIETVNLFKGIPRVANALAQKEISEVWKEGLKWTEDLNYHHTDFKVPTNKF